MTILIKNLLLAELHNFSDKKLKDKMLLNVKQFESFFKSPNNFDVRKIQRIPSDENNQLFAFKVTSKLRLIFSAEFDKEDELNIMLLKMAK